MGRRKFTATDTLDATVYAIWDDLAMIKPSDQDEDDPADVGIFNSLRDRGLDVADVDLTGLSGWLAKLREAEDGLRFRRLQLEALQTDRRCPVCSSAVAGRSDRIYCSSNCRVAAHRRNVQTDPRESTPGKP